MQFLRGRYHFPASDDEVGGREMLPEYVVMFSPTAKKIDALLDRALYIAVRLLVCMSKQLVLLALADSLPCRLTSPMCGFAVQEASFFHSDVSGDADSSEVLDKMIVYRRA